MIVKEIRDIARNIREEVHDAMKYIDQAIAVRGQFPAVGDLYYSLCKEELGHAHKLHDEAVKLIDRMRDSRQVPETMLDIWNFEHEMIMQDEADVKRKMELYAA
jgi:1,2-phenylacetyl-CoA epoxidase catalytic subunit